MNAPERLLPPSGNVLGTLSICYAPLIDAKRKAIGTRLTMLSAKPQERLPIGNVLSTLNNVWPDSSAAVLVAPLDAEFDRSMLEWDAPKNAILEIPSVNLRDPDAQLYAQQLFRDGKRLAIRGRPDTPLPPSLLSCFELSLIHIPEARRVQANGAPNPEPPAESPRIPVHN